MHSHRLSDRQLYDLEMIMNGGFSPLIGFLNEDDYNSVIDNMRLSDGKLWPIPITLDVSEEFKNQIKLGDKVVLVNTFKTEIAYLTIDSIYTPYKNREALKVFGTLDDTHPAVNHLYYKTEGWYIGGTITKIADPIHTSYQDLRRTPDELKQYFNDNNMKNIIGFQTRNPMHKSHYTITKLALNEVPNSHLLIHPVVGLTKSGDIDYHTRVKCYQEIVTKYEEVTLSLLPLAMRMAGPREALWHALIRKNYGCTHFIVGRDHAGPGKNKDGKNFYDPYAGQELCNRYSEEMGIEILTFSEIGYIEELKIYSEINKVYNKEDYTILNISGTQLRQKLLDNNEIPEWFAFPEVVKLLRKDSGVTILMTGLSGSGKSTIAYYLRERLLEGTKVVNILDGDEIRENLSKELGFSKQDRDTNIRRIAYVASLIAKNAGVTIVPCISPYAETRQYFREICQKWGKFVEIYISTPLETCEERDVKGLYQMVRQGEIKNFTGISDPYEIPTDPDLSIDTSKYSIPETVDLIMDHLAK